MRETVQLLKQASGKKSKHLINGFFQGLGWAFGATVGFALLIALLVFLLKQFGQLPIVGSWFNWAGQSIEDTSATKFKKEIAR